VKIIVFLSNHFSGFNLLKLMDNYFNLIFNSKNKGDVKIYQNLKKYRIRL